MTTKDEAHCEHDFERARRVGRARWVCPKCNRDITLEYYFWAEAVHPEWFKANDRKDKL
jgi:transposase-like protein